MTRGRFIAAALRSLRSVFESCMELSVTCARAAALMAVFSGCVVTPPPTFVSSEEPHSPSALPGAANQPNMGSMSPAVPAPAPPAAPAYAAAPQTATDTPVASVVTSEASPVPTAIPPQPFQSNPNTSVSISAKSVARRYGNLSPAACAKQLPAFKGMFKRVGAQKGVASPVRVVGEIEGVRFRVPGEKSKFGVLDCRLALTLVELARFLRSHDVVEVVVDNFYRVNARLPGRRSKRSQHAYGLAIDLRSFRLADGTVWDVEQDWGASIDTEACGPGATLVSPTEHTLGLRNLVCEMFEAQLFSHHLTPSHDMAHRNHLHLDIKRDAKSVVIR